MTANRPFSSPDVRRHGGACAPAVAPLLYFGAAFAAGMLLRAATVPLSVSAQPQTLTGPGARAIRAFTVPIGTCNGRAMSLWVRSKK